MDLSSSPSYNVITKLAIKGPESISNESDKSTLHNNEISAINSSLYDSAIQDDQTTFASINENDNNNDDNLNLRTIASDSTYCKIDTSSTSTATMTLNNASGGSAPPGNQMLPLPLVEFTELPDDVHMEIEFSRNIQSIDVNTSQEEVDPKSQLANKTIFKTDNPNLSIIEINENSFKDEDIEKSVVLIETSSDEENDENMDQKQLKKIKSNVMGTVMDVITVPKSSPNKSSLENAADKRRRKAESLLYSSKQKLNIAVAEASAAEHAIASSVALPSNGSIQPETKRPLIIYDTLEEFENNLPSTVTILNTPFGSKVYLVGTAHFSEESQDDVSFVIRNVRPDVVMVELCTSRIPILKLDEKTLLEEAKNINLAKIKGILQTHGCINGIFFILLLQMSAQIARDLGMAPGGEFRRAFEEIHRLPGCILHLGDRPIRITLHRALHALSLWQTIKLVWRLTSNNTISMEEVEECKQRDLLEKLMKEMAGEFPAFSNVFVKERDLFLCHSLQLAALPQSPSDGSNIPRPVRVVGIVGIGHANGIAKMWGHVDPNKIPDIMEIPPARLSTRLCKYTIKYGLISLGLFGVFKLLRPRFMRT
uniref:TraB domain-containing protein n=1 Tax=Glossina brevipalpis TaxID=37001 RepID=A0A1A9WS39_9MUSC